MKMRILFTAALLCATVGAQAQPWKKLLGNAPDRYEPQGEMVFTTADYKAFDEAKPHAVTRVVDGDNLWMYVKFNKSLEEMVGTGDAALTETDPATGVQTRGVQFSYEIGPPGDLMKDYSISGRQESHGGPHSGRVKQNPGRYFGDVIKQNEIKACISPGDMVEASYVLPIEVLTRGVAGVWPHEVRVFAGTKLLVKATITFDVSAGFPKYKKVADALERLTTRGNVVTNKLPPVSPLRDTNVLKMVTAAFKEREKITPTKVYLQESHWQVHPNPDNPSSRLIHAVVSYPYQSQCMYTVVQVRQDFDRQRGKFREDGIGTGLVFDESAPYGRPISCEQVK